jgi:hypothetical protein
MIALLLAATLALPAGAEAVRIADDAWPEKIAEVRAGERVWWWSKDCVPQLLTAGPSAMECAAPMVRRVLVVDRDSGKKLPGARVVWGTDAMRVDLPDAMLPSAITGVDGDALLQFPPSGMVRVRVDGPRAASWWQSVTPGDAPVRLAAVPASPASVQVTVAGSEPALHAVVQIEVSDVRSWAVARDGRITIPAIPPVPVTVATWSDASAPVVMELDAAQLPRVLDLPRGWSVSGRIVDARRRPIEDAAIEGIVAIGKLPRGLRRHARSTRAGTFVLHGIPAGPMQLKFRKAGRATVVRGIEAVGDVDAGDITLRASRQLALRVVDSGGRPVAGATARVTGGPSGSTGRDGIARIDAVSAEDDVAVQVAAEGFRATEIEVAVDAKFPLDVELSRGVRVIGSVVSAKSGERAGPGDVLVNNNGTQRVVTFDESGAIDIGGLDQGKLAFEIRAQAMTPLKIDARTLSAGEIWDLGTLRLDQGAAIAGIVLDGQMPLPGARIRALRRSGVDAGLAVVMSDWIAATSGDDGAFTVAGLASGSHVLLFDALGFAPRVVTVDVDADAGDGDAKPMKVALERARGLAIDCAPVRRCGSEARLLYAGAEYPWASASATLRDGKARIAAAAPGNSLLRLVGEGQVVHERTVAIGAAAETEVEIRLVDATLRGIVSSAGRARRDGGTVELRARTSPSAGVPIYLEHRTPDGQVSGGAWQSDLPSMESAPVDESGQFVFAELEPGQYEAIYRREGRASRPVTLTAGPGISNVVIEVAPGELRGRVMKEDGTPAGFATVKIIDASRSELVVRSDQFGRFEAIGIAAGRAIVSAESDRMHAATEVDIDLRGTASVELVMRRE